MSVTYADVVLVLEPDSFDQCLWLSVVHRRDVLLSYCVAWISEWELKSLLVVVPIKCFLFNGTTFLVLNLNVARNPRW